MQEKIESLLKKWKTKPVTPDSQTIIQDLKALLRDAQDEKTSKKSKKESKDDDSTKTTFSSRVETSA